LCWDRRGRAAGAELGLAFAKLFVDRFVTGVSHPKELKRLPSLIWKTRPTAPVLVIDDFGDVGLA
jgi:hypothetical protein